MAGGSWPYFVNNVKNKCDDGDPYSKHGDGKEW